MALVDCPECGHQVSTLAAACPQCGFPLADGEALLPYAPRPRGPSRWTDPGFWIILIGLVAVIVMSVLILRHFDDGSGPTTTAPSVTVGAPALEAVAGPGPGLTASNVTGLRAAGWR